MHIGWSASSGIATNPGAGGSLHRGIWAGHSFGITTLEAHLQQSKREPWKAWEDSSDEVCREIAEVWGRNHGFDWHRKIVKWHEELVERRQEILRRWELGLSARDV
jgi:hypothetical protein